MGKSNSRKTFKKHNMQNKRNCIKYCFYDNVQKCKTEEMNNLD